VLALSKADLVGAERARAAVDQWRRRLGPEVPVIATSSATRQGLEELASTLLRSTGALGTLQDTAPDGAQLAGQVAAGDQGLAEHMVFRPSAGSGFQVQRLGPHAFAVRGRGIELLLKRHDVENEDAMAYLEGRLRRIGVLKALEAEGFQAGDEIEIAGVTFELDPTQ
jgi:GTP-binding protein